MSWASGGGGGQTCRFCLACRKVWPLVEAVLQSCQTLRVTALDPVIPRALKLLMFKKKNCSVCVREIDLGMQVSWYTFGRQKTA